MYVLFDNDSNNFFWLVLNLWSIIKFSAIFSFYNQDGRECQSDNSLSKTVISHNKAVIKVLLNNKNPAVKFKI